MAQSDPQIVSPFSIDQRRAQAAQQAVAAVSLTDQEHYFGEAKKMPVRIMASGLGQALAFIAAKAKKRDGLKSLQSSLSDWVLGRIKPAACGIPCPAETPQLLHQLIHSDAAFVRRATDETLAYLKWLNRFAEAVEKPAAVKPK